MQAISETEARRRAAELADGPGAAADAGSATGETRSELRRPYLLGIVGSPGTGKTTFAGSLGQPVLPMDGYHFANEHLERERLHLRKGAPDTFDVGGFAAILRRLRAGESVLAPRFHRELEESIAGALPIGADAPLVVVEGNYLLYDRCGWERIGPLLDEVWYLEVPEAVRLSRLIERHVRFGRERPEAERWVQAVDEPNARAIESSRDRASCIVRLDAGETVSPVDTEGADE